MDYMELLNDVLSEIRLSTSSVKAEDAELLASKIVNTKRLFCDGKGRSALMIKGFAMRLAQMDMAVFDTQGVTVPAIECDDILLIASGSGETENLLEHARKAKKIGAEVVLLTAEQNSTLKQLSDICICFEAKSKLQKETNSVQPMGTLFEQSIMVFFDVVVLFLMEKLSLTGEDMYRLHNNLE